VTHCDRTQQEYERREVAMENVYLNYEIIKEFSSRRPAADFHRGASANKSEKYPSCGRDLSQPNNVAHHPQHGPLHPDSFLVDFFYPPVTDVEDSEITYNLYVLVVKFFQRLRQERSHMTIGCI
jgi:hypothetical protein